VRKAKSQAPSQTLRNRWIRSLRGLTQRTSARARRQRPRIRDVPLQGPFLPSGAFFSEDETLFPKIFPHRGFVLENSTKSKTKSRDDRGGNGKPVYLPFVVLSRHERKLLSNNPSKKVKDKFSPGPLEVYPTRESVQIHQRWTWTYLYYRSILERCEDWVPDKKISNLLIKARSGVSSLMKDTRTDYIALRVLQSQLSFWQRQMKKVDQRSGGKL